MKCRIAAQLFGVATSGSNIKGLFSDLKICDRQERVLKRKINSRYAGFIFSVVAAPQGKVCMEVIQRAGRRILGYPCDYLASMTKSKKRRDKSLNVFLVDGIVNL
jgi:hypothetical protein